jgi:hypothetical protein
MANYKQQVTASELVSSIPVRTGLTAVYGTYGASADPIVSVGSVASAGLGGASIRILDQRGGASQGWQTIIPGQAQTVQTTGVAQILVEATGDAGVVAAKSTGAFVLGPVVAAGIAVNIAGVTLTEGVEWLKGANTGEAATNLSLAIAANSGLGSLVQVVDITVVTVTSRSVNLRAQFAGAWGDQILLASTGASIVASGIAMTGGFDTGTGTVMAPVKLFSLIGECIARGCRTELYYVGIGNAPIFNNFASATLEGEWEPNQYWPLNGRV